MYGGSLRVGPSRFPPRGPASRETLRRSIRLASDDLGDTGARAGRVDVVRDGSRFRPVSSAVLPARGGGFSPILFQGLPTHRVLGSGEHGIDPSALRSSIRCVVLLDRKEVGMTALVRWLLVRRLLAVATGTLLGVGLWVVALSPGSAYAERSCCGLLPSLFSFTTASSGCGTNPPGSVSPAQCVQGTNNGTACASDATCTGGGVCRGHLNCSGLYFGGGQPSGVNLPATVPDRGLSYSKVASCSG